MSNITEIIDNLTKYFNTKNINFVISGGVAIKYLCDLYSIKNNIQINNLDIYYMANTPITNEYIHDYHRIQTAPHSSLSYKTNDGFKINITMTRSNRMKYIEFNNIKLMHPHKLVSFYDEDDLTMEIAEKLDILTELISITKHLPDLYLYKDSMYKDEDISSSEPIEPLSKRLLFS
jgi:hypothetical protein